MRAAAAAYIITKNIPRRRTEYPLQSGSGLFTRGGYVESSIYSCNTKCNTKFQIPYGTREKAMRVTGVEPARLSAQDPKSCAYANFATPAHSDYIIY